MWKFWLKPNKHSPWVSSLAYSFSLVDGTTHSLWPVGQPVGSSPQHHVSCKMKTSSSFTDVMNSGLLFPRVALVQVLAVWIVLPLWSLWWTIAVSLFFPQRGYTGSEYVPGSWVIWVDDEIAYFTVLVQISEKCLWASLHEFLFKLFSLGFINNLWGVVAWIVLPVEWGDIFCRAMGEGQLLFQLECHVFGTSYHWTDPV